MISGTKLLFLKDLYVGETAEIVYMDRCLSILKRLRDMGLREGVLIELISYDSLINKKVVLKIGDSFLAFESDIAEYIRVRPIKPWYNFYREQAFYDALTGCLNRNAAFLIMHAEYEKAFSNKIPLSLILIDIDDFKKINDTYGHSFGDRVLQQLGSLLRKSIRRTDLVFRWGGEEFLIIMKGLTVGESYIVAERLREKVQCIEITPYGKGLVRISVGLDGIPPYVNLDELIDRIDRALYLAKSRGKNQVCTFFWRSLNETL
ncbi:MAG: diguanylate cyclase [Thermodesulfovibrio sp.]|nr:diguanylate cyclase [Thermodesulfovibrio sp.]